MIITICTILTVDEITYMSDIIAHTIKGMYSSRISVHAKLVFFGLTYIIAVLVVELDSIESDIEEVAVRRVQVDLE